MLLFCIHLPLSYKTMSTIVDPGDTVIIEAPSYPGTLSILKPLGCNVVSIPVDVDGLPPQLLQRALVDAQQQGRRVKAICIIPNGQNPSGCTMSLERRRQVYALARDANVLIVEDDPYYFLQYGSGSKTLCGDTLHRLADQGTRGKVCEVCRIVASHLRAVVQ